MDCGCWISIDSMVVVVRTRVADRRKDEAAAAAALSSFRLS